VRAIDRDRVAGHEFSGRISAVGESAGNWTVAGGYIVGADLGAVGRRRDHRERFALRSAPGLWSGPAARRTAR
jgi:threonine dehydrogenase-like Zn-dependent dehydrogenase